MDDDSIEDIFDDNYGTDDSSDDGIIEDEPGDDGLCDEFTDQDVFMTGTAFGFGYEEGQEEAERRRLIKKMDKERD